jgi:hypothetical protein
VITSVHRKIVYGLVLFCILLAIIDISLLLEFAHIVFEFIESTLDTLIELLFETGTRETQIIVFYVILAFIGYFFYRLYRLVPDFIDGVKQDWFYVKSVFTNYWQNLDQVQRIKLYACGFGALYLLSLFFM